MGKSVEKAVRKLFEETFIRHCKLENNPITTDEASEAINADIYNVIDNLQMIIDSLLAFKQSCISEDKSELIQRNEQFENMLQKLEAEIRNHIRVEHQLKLHIESNQLTIDLDPKNNRLKKKKILSDCLEKVEFLENKLAKKNSIIHKLEMDFVKLKTISEKISGKNKKKNDKRKKEIFNEITEKFEKKNPGVQHMQSLVKQISAERMKNNNRYKRNSKSPVRNLLHLRSESEQIRSPSVPRKTH